MTKLAKDDLDKIKARASKEAKNWIKVGMSTCGIAAGSDVVFNTLIEEAKKRNIDIQIKRCGCQGMCFAEPLVEVKTEGLPAVIYGKVNKDVAIKILEKHACAGILVKDHIFELRSKV
jgi:NADH-quinone oxidoreductase subunit F